MIGITFEHLIGEGRLRWGYLLQRKYVLQVEVGDADPTREAILSQPQHVAPCTCNVGQKPGGATFRCRDVWAGVKVQVGLTRPVREKKVQGGDTQCLTLPLNTGRYLFIRAAWKPIELGRDP